ncbi:hypothetical protein GR140_30610 (plasmid) [Pseudomonas putida]|uniref:hypothetical protein n=1 Tax=Pseudomonas putida TaxID=303 RepID=UPI001BB07C4B|nr:hypothetical protein [Pseudomonas putida]QUG93120.1 hypothetical protein GR140_30610 [Pseudomonas putida]
MIFVPCLADSCLCVGAKELLSSNSQMYRWQVGISPAPQQGIALLELSLELSILLQGSFQSDVANTQQLGADGVCLGVEGLS